MNERLDKDMQRLFARAHRICADGPRIVRSSTRPGSTSTGPALSHCLPNIVMNVTAKEIRRFEIDEIWLWGSVAAGESAVSNQLH